MIFDGCGGILLKKRFDFLRNSPHSSIYIHFGVELLVFGASLTSASLSKNPQIVKTHISKLQKYSHFQPLPI